MKAVCLFLIQFYVRHLPFPHRGYKYFEQFMRWLGLLQQPFEKKMPQGFRMHLSLEDHIEKQLFWYGVYEPKEMQVLLKFIHPESVVVDAGANVGYVSLLVSSVAVNGRVVAFEPGKRALSRFYKNLSLNPLLNVEIVPKALGNEIRNCKFYPSSGDNLGMSGLTPAENFGGFEEQIEMTTLDAFMNEQQWKQLDLVKIDLEGAEYSTLQGMKEVLIQLRPTLFIEISCSNLARFSHHPQQVLEFLSSLGYQLFHIQKDGRIKKTNEILDSSLMIFQPEEKKFPDAVEVIFESLS